jgi:hypothetical protein
VNRFNVVLFPVLDLEVSSPKCDRQDEAILLEESHAHRGPKYAALLRQLDKTERVNTNAISLRRPNAYSNTKRDNGTPQQLVVSK